MLRKKCVWFPPKYVIDNLDETISKIWTNQINPEEARIRFESAYNEMYDRCIAEHLEIPIEKLEEVPEKRKEEAIEHCSREHPEVNMLFGLQDYDKPDAKKAWETALDILNIWVTEKKKKMEELI